MAKSVCIIHITNSVNIEKLGQYRKTRPRLVLAEFFCIGLTRIIQPDYYVRLSPPYILKETSARKRDIVALVLAEFKFFFL